MYTYISVYEHTRVYVYKYISVQSIYNLESACVLICPIYVLICPIYVSI